MMFAVEYGSGHFEIATNSDDLTPEAAEEYLRRVAAIAADFDTDNIRHDTVNDTGE